MPRSSSNDMNSLDARINQYRRDRKKFAVKAYLLAVVFLLISLVQWLPLMYWEQCNDSIKENYYIPLIFLFIGLIAVSVIVFFPRVRFMFPVNWIIILCIVELMTLGLTLAVINVSVLSACIFFWAVMAIVVICVAFGMFLKFDATLNVVVIFIFSVIFFVGMVLFLSIYLVTGQSFTIMFYSIFIIAIVLVFLIYHAQTIQGGRYAEMRLKDYLLAALIIYYDFIILFMAFLTLDAHFFKI